MLHCSAQFKVEKADTTDMAFAVTDTGTLSLDGKVLLHEFRTGMRGRSFHGQQQPKHDDDEEPSRGHDGAGHGRREIIDAVTRQAQSGLLTNYCFPSEIRARMVERLGQLLPEPLKKVFLLTTGSETVEAAIKLCRIHGVKHGGSGKHVVVSFRDAFHGRTLLTMSAMPCGLEIRRLNGL